VNRLLPTKNEGVGLIDRAIRLVSKVSKLCDHNPPTLQTDGQTDRQSDRRTDDMRSQDHAYALKCIAR